MSFCWTLPRRHLDFSQGSETFLWKHQPSMPCTGVGLCTFGNWVHDVKVVTDAKIWFCTSGGSIDRSLSWFRLRLHHHSCSTLPKCSANKQETSVMLMISGSKIVVFHSFPQPTKPERWTSLLDSTLKVWTLEENNQECATIGWLVRANIFQNLYLRGISTVPEFVQGAPSVW